MKVADWPVSQLADQVVVHDDLGDAAVGHAAHEAGPAELGIVDLQPQARRQQHAGRGDHPHDPGLLVRGLQDDHGQADIGPVFGGDALDQRALLGLGAGRRVAADLPVAMDGADRALRESAGRTAPAAPPRLRRRGRNANLRCAKRNTWRPNLPIIPFPTGPNPGGCARIAASWIPCGARLSYPAAPPSHTMQIGVFATLSPPAVTFRPWIGNIRENIQIVASDRGPCTLRLRRNYGLRSPGNPLPPHRLPRSAAPPGAPYRERVLICNDAPGAARTRHDRFRRRSNDDDAGA